MNNSFDIYSILALTGCLLCGIAFAWVLYGKQHTITAPLRITLAVIRVLSVTLILWLLFSPLLMRLSYTLEKPVVVIAQDNSQSVGTVLPVGFDSLQYRKDFQQLSESLAQKYDVRLYSFSDRVRDGLDFSYKGQSTNAAALASLLADELRNRNVGAVILATDGIFNRGGNPSPLFEALNAPIYTVTLGDTIPKKDIVITNVIANDLVYLDNDFEIEVQVQAYQSDGELSKMSVFEGGKEVHNELLQIRSSMFSKNIPLRLSASKLGRHQYTIILSAVSNEISLKNNRQQISIEVIDDRKSILIAAEGPHPDLAAIRQALILNKHYKVSVVINKDLLHIDPKDYSLLILYQLPGNQSDLNGFIQKVVAAKVPVWYVLGAQSNIGKFNAMQDQVSVNGNTGALQYIYSVVNKDLSAFDLDSASRRTIEGFDPLQAPFGTINISGPNQSILNQRIGKVKTSRPQLFFMNDKGRKTGFLIGEGLWKWKLAESAEHVQVPIFNGLIGNIVQYLSVKDDQRKFKAQPVKNTFDEGEHILLNAVLYNDSYVAINTPDVNIAIKDQSGKTYNFSFSRYESSYQLDAGILPSGNYIYTAGTALGNKKYEASGSFLVSEQMAEFQQTIANHQLLYHLSSQTKGKTYTAGQLAKLKDELLKDGQLKTLSYEDRKYEELIGIKWIFALILFLLSTEWFVRKRNAVP